ncbi:MAG: MoaD/ThiS family protein [Oceanospirillaceae bacterium]|nr:MoaD/ThiS family protein [Oceanospirillaceae bacterium]
MATLAFTRHLDRYLDCPPQTVEAGTVADALALALEANPRLAGYLLDDQRRLRRNVAIFVDGRQIRDRRHLSDALDADSKIYVLQALSGG